MSRLLPWRAKAILPFLPRKQRRCRSKPAPTVPSVVLLFVDDLGYADTGPFGHTDIPTPKINLHLHGGDKAWYDDVEFRLKGTK